MKLTLIIIMASLLQVSAATYAQRVTFKKNNVTLAEVFDEIRQQTGYNILYSPDLINDNTRVNANYRGTDLRKVLEQLIDADTYSYTIDNKNILITKVKPKTFFQKLSDAFAAVTLLGKVTDENGLPMPGAAVTVKGTKNSTIADASGAFSITINSDKDILVVSFIGYETRELPVASLKTPLNISLKHSTSNLDQVQVIAYGTTTKRLNTGDVTTITAADIEKNPVTNVLEAMQGKVPGLFIQQSTGQPGGAFSLRLRDAANFSSTNGAPTPLVVVDGVTYPGAKLPMETNTLYGTGNFIQGGNGLNFLNPNDIESISVLKDADATSLYGASGAYGVILITTKKAKPGPTTLNINVYDGISMLGQTVQPMNTQQYLMLRAEALKNDGAAIGPGDKDLNGTYPTNRNVDFKKELLGGLAQSSNINMTCSGGTQNSSFLVGGSLRDNGNIQRHKGSSTDGSLRFSLNTNTADNKLSYSIAGTYLSNVNTMVPYDFSRLMSFTPPNAPDPFLPDGTVNWDPNIVNYMGDINRTYRAVTNNLLANTNLVYRPVKGLSLRANVGYSNISGDELMGYPTTTMAPTVTNAAASTHSIFHHYQVRDITIEPYAEYARTFLEKGDFNFKLGGKIDNNLSTLDEISGTGFASDALLSNPSVATTVTTTYGYTPYRDLGAYAIMKLVWDQKYIINLNGRRDGSTRFGPGKQFGNFGSVAAAWIFSEERFVKDELGFLSYGKLRGSTGIIGGDAIGDFAYLSKYTASSGTYSGKTILNPGGLANPQLSWEHNKNKEIGLELGFLKDRIYLEGNYYSNIATNQLINIPLPAVTGVTSYPVNTDAIIRTSGWEMSLSTNNIRAQNFNWTTRFNMSIPTSKLLQLPTYYSLASNYILNKPVTGILLYNFAGVNTQTGNAAYTNAKGVTADNPSLGAADKTEFRDLAPKYYGGFQNTFNYKHFSLDFSFTFTSRLTQNALAQNGFPVGYNGVNGSTVWLKRWQNPGDITSVPKVSATITNLLNFSTLYTNSTGAYSDATYARLQNASLRYTFTGNILSKMHVKSLSVYVQGQNLFTISNLGGLDPENLSITVIPPMRTITSGLNVSL